MSTAPEAKVPTGNYMYRYGTGVPLVPATGGHLTNATLLGTSTIGTGSSDHTTIGSLTGSATFLVGTDISNCAVTQATTLAVLPNAQIYLEVGDATSRLEAGAGGTNGYIDGRGIVNMQILETRTGVLYGSLTQAALNAQFPPLTSQGVRVFITDSNVNPVGNYGAVVGPGVGGFKACVWCDGTNFRIG